MGDCDEKLRHQAYYVLIPTAELADRIPRRGGSRWQVYLTIYGQDRCYDTRGLKQAEMREVLERGCRERARDYCAYLNAWDELEKCGR